jgi:predicted phosphodiesterase
VKVLVIGDTHAAWHRLYDGVQQAFRDHEVEAAIQVGDFGLFKQFEPHPLGDAGRFRFPVPLHVIDGNHEDHKWLKSRIETGVTKKWAEEQNIIVQQRGTIVKLHDITVGFCGGALHADRAQEGSIDRGTTNWVTNREAERAAGTFTDEKVDLIVTHSCPHSIGIGMIGNPHLTELVERNITRKGHDAGPISDCGEPGLLRLWARLRHRPKEWVFGHFHTHRAMEVHGVKFRCVGAIDGSDGRADPLFYILDTTSWIWDTMTMGRADISITPTIKARR